VGIRPQAQSAFREGLQDPFRRRVGLGIGRQSIQTRRGKLRHRIGRRPSACHSARFAPDSAPSRLPAVWAATAATNPGLRPRSPLLGFEPS
jgi:hypothetical protein